MIVRRGAQADSRPPSRLPGRARSWPRATAPQVAGQATGIAPAAAHKVFPLAGETRIFSCWSPSPGSFSATAVPSVPRDFLRLLRSPWLRRFVAATVLLAISAWVYLEDDHSGRRGPFALEVGLATEQAGSAQVFFDRGRGFRQVDSSSLQIEAASTPVRQHFSLGWGTLRRLRLDPLNGYDGAAVVERPRIVDTRTGEVVRSLDLDTATPNEDVATYTRTGATAHLAGHRGSGDMQLVFILSEPVQLGPTALQRMASVAPSVILWLACLALVAWALDALAHAASCGGRTTALVGWLALHPRFVIVVTAAAAIAACCHPTVFLGRSMFSTEYGLPLLHPEHPAKPGAPGGAVAPAEDGKGADTGAMLWQHFPYSVVQHRALTEEGVFPWWNRYNSAGVELFGQGQSMLGDPLHAAVLLAGAAVWAWDAKLIIARLLFALGVGFAAFAATRRLGASVLATATAPFIGFFAYRLNHPAIVTVGYAPWLLACWIEVARSVPNSGTRGWLFALGTANFCLLTSGTVKEAAMLALVLNVTGCAIALAMAPSPEHRRRLALTSALLFMGGVLLLAPWWLSFVDTWQDSWTAYDAPYAIRIPPARWIGLFDGMFHSELMQNRTVYAPSANAVVLLGLVFAGFSWRDLGRSPIAPACAIAAGVALSLAYDVPWIVNQWILLVPLVRSIGHLGNTFSCVAIPLLMILAAQGFASGRRPQRRLRAPFLTWILVVLAGFSLIAYELAIAWSATGEWRMDDVFARHGYFLGSTLALIVGGGCLMLGLRWMQGADSSRLGAGTLLVLAGSIAMLARHGQTVAAAHSDYFLNPAARSDLLAPSPALEWIRARATEPFRMVGVDSHIFAGYAAVHRIESPNGPDALANRAYRELAESAGLATTRDWYFPTDPASLTHQRRVFDMLNVRYYATCPQSSPPPEWTVPRVSLDLAVAESPSAWPRAFFTSTVRRYRTVAEFLAALEQGDGTPFAAIRAEEAATVRDDAPERGTSHVVPARDYVLGANRTAFTIAAPSAGVAVLMEAWVPDRFIARVNGQVAPVLRVNHAFKGVWLPEAGHYEIAFDYRPSHPLARFALPFAGLLLLGTALARGIPRRS